MGRPGAARPCRRRSCRRPRGHLGRTVMNPATPLIRQEPVAWFAGKKAQSPTVAVVYSTADGKLESLGRPINFGQSMVSGYKVRYDVDTSDHECTVDIPPKQLPSSLDAFHFDASIQFG